jgi:Transposase DDE domain group 1
MARAWAAGAGPGDGPMTIDLDSTVCEVHGHHKGGAASGYTRILGYHPLLATRADTGEVLHARQRTGRAASGRGAERFVTELAGRVRRAGADGPLTLRADSGFWSAKVLTACRRHRIRFSITVRQTATVAAAIASVPEQAWVDIDYPDGGQAQVAQTTLGDDRLVVRRTAWSARRPRCGRIGATTPSSPTGRAARWSWTPTTAAMPSASWPSAT